MIIKANNEQIVFIGNTSAHLGSRGLVGSFRWKTSFYYSLVIGSTGLGFREVLHICSGCNEVQQWFLMRRFMEEKRCFSAVPATSGHEKKLSLFQELLYFDGDALKFWVFRSHACQDAFFSLMRIKSCSPEGLEKEEGWRRKNAGSFSFSGIVQTNWD